MRISYRAQKLKPSATMKVAAMAKNMMTKGIDVVNFGVGEPDFNTPQHIKEAGIKAINDNFTRYTKAPGIDELRAVISNKLKTDNSLNYSPEQIIVSPGAKASLFYALFAVCSKGDKVLIPSPYWVTYPPQVELCDATPIIIQTKEKNGFKLTASEMKEVIKKEGKIKLLILNSPSNPTGSVYTKDELFAIAELCLKNNILVLSDEIYEKLIYDGAEHYSIATHSSEMKEKTILVNGVSKSFAMTGWRMGYTAAASDIIAKMGSIQSQLSSNVNSITQMACLKAIGTKTDDVENMRVQFEKRKDFMVKELTNIENVSCTTPQGAFYAFPNISSFLGKSIKNDVDFCTFMLEKFFIALVPGSAFGADSYVRFSYANSMENLKKGIDRFKEGLSSI